MMRKNILMDLKVQIFLLAIVLLGASPSRALDLAAVEGVWAPPDGGAPITMWGFVADTTGICPGVPVVWDMGPVQKGVPGGDLTINLLNCLSEPVSLVIPGQNGILDPQVITDAQGRQRVRAFTHEAAPGGGTATYTWTNLKSGTYLYQSGSNVARQMHMGLYGALTVGNYAGASDEALIVFSEIDPALHAIQASATPYEYKPKYFLINGDTYTSAQPVPVVHNNVTAKKNLLLRLVNAGLMSHIPVMQGPYMEILAEDGNPYPYPREQYSILLAAGKTIDALWQPQKKGTYALYDRSLSLSTNSAPGGGLLVYLSVDRTSFPWVLLMPAISGAVHGTGM